MFNYIKGITTETFKDRITLENHDIGYDIRVANPSSFIIGEIVTVYIHFHMREDSVELFGFHSREEQTLFENLITVKGLGPKGALSILEGAKEDEITAKIEEQDAKFFSHFPGIGPKLSQQIILDLKGKLNFLKITTNKEDSLKLRQIQDGLKSLGYSKQEILSVTNEIDLTNSDTKDLMRTCLKCLSKQ